MLALSVRATVPQTQPIASSQQTVKVQELQKQISKEFKENKTEILSKEDEAFNKIKIESEASTVMKSKIEWAVNELRQSNNIKYNIELCELIKALAETIVSLEKI